MDDKDDIDDADDGDGTGTENSEKKSGFVALVGRPNVGKSTLMNYLIGQKIAITSNRPQTTRNRIRTVYTDERGQIVFVDTPGIHKAKNKLGNYMVETANSTMGEVDVILWLVEPTTYIGAGERQIMENLRQVTPPVILVMNKADTVKREELLPAIKAYSDAFHFTEIIPVSALTGENTDTLMEVLFSYLKTGPMFYDEETVTDETMRDIAAELIREQTLRFLKDEIPHGIAVMIDAMSERPEGGLWDIEASIVCEKDTHKGIIIGKQGSMLKKIGSAARIEIEKMMEAKVNLKLFVKVRKEWRDDERKLKEFGYYETRKKR
ncbi:MAG: GTPase Era [Lachnospiraceae bacterium]|nr:GTPase Era [Lachnospiraceae bacterium]